MRPRPRRAGNVPGCRSAQLVERTLALPVSLTRGGVFDGGLFGDLDDDALHAPSPRAAALRSGSSSTPREVVAAAPYESVAQGADALMQQTVGPVRRAAR